MTDGWQLELLKETLVLRTALEYRNILRDHLPWLVKNAMDAPLMLLEALNLLNEELLPPPRQS